MSKPWTIERAYRDRFNAKVEQMLMPPHSRCRAIRMELGAAPKGEA